MAWFSHPPPLGDEVVHGVEGSDRALCHWPGRDLVAVLSGVRVVSRKFSQRNWKVEMKAPYDIPIFLFFFSTTKAAQPACCWVKVQNANVRIKRTALTCSSHQSPKERAPLSTR
jgi:hypothetical protein